MGIKFILVSVFLIIAIVTNILVYMKLLKNSSSDTVSDDSIIQAQMLMLDRKLTEVKSNISELYEKIQFTPQQFVEIDELSMYVKNGIHINEIAKKMNKSVKEIELMLKMRGLV